MTYYQNSNDLVKRHNSHLQNSVFHDTELAAALDGDSIPGYNIENPVTATHDQSGGDDTMFSSSEGQQLLLNQQRRQVTEGYANQGSSAGPSAGPGAAGPGPGVGAGVGAAGPGALQHGSNNTALSGRYLKNQKNDEFLVDVRNQYTSSQNRITAYSDFINVGSALMNATTNNRWVTVRDSSGTMAYGYINKMGVLEQWSSMDDIRANSGKYGCPSNAVNTTPITIKKPFSRLRPYEVVSDERGNPLFYFVDNFKRTSGVTSSCGNEGKNIWAYKSSFSNLDGAPKCVSFTDANNGGMEQQTDMGLTTVGACKRRAEDVGAVQFAMGNNEGNLGTCYISKTVVNPSSYTLTASCNTAVPKQTADSDQNPYLPTSSSIGRTVDVTTNSSNIVYYMYGNWIGRDIPVQSIAYLPNRERVYLVEDYPYVKMVLESGEARYYVGRIRDFNGGNWANYPSAGNRSNGNYVIKSATNSSSTTSRVSSFALYTLKSGSNYDAVDPKVKDTIGKVGYVTNDGKMRVYDPRYVKLSNKYSNIGNYDSAGSGYDLGNLRTVGSSEQCADLCTYYGSNNSTTTDTCKAYVYDGNTKQCQLKTDKAYPAGLRQPMMSKNANMTLNIRQPEIIKRDPKSTCPTSFEPVDTLLFSGYPASTEGPMIPDSSCNIQSRLLGSLNTTFPSNAVNLENRSGAWGNYFRDGIQNFTKSFDKVMHDLDADTNRAILANYRTKTAELLRENKNYDAIKPTLDGVNEESELLRKSEVYNYLLWFVLAILLFFGIYMLTGVSDGDNSGSTGDGSAAQFGGYARRLFKNWFKHGD